MADPKKFVPTAKHKVSLADASDPYPTITLYGKLIDKVSLTPSPDGITHPFDLKEDLLAASVCGYSHAGTSYPVKPPAQVMLPHPDGEATGCGWDKQQGFVEWRNIPKNWQTLHIQTQAKPLFSALRLSTAPGAAPNNSRDIILGWANLPSGPIGTRILGDLWLGSKDPSAGVWAVGAQTLARDLRPYALPGQDITTAFISAYQKKTVNDLVGDLGW